MGRQKAWMKNNIIERNPIILEHPSLKPVPVDLAFHGRKEVVGFRDDLEKMRLQVGTSTCTPRLYTVKPSELNKYRMGHKAG